MHSPLACDAHAEERGPPTQTAGRPQTIPIRIATPGSMDSAAHKERIVVFRLFSMYMGTALTRGLCPPGEKPPRERGQNKGHGPNYK